ncbi:ABC transporter ATP-binding protein/permease [Desulfovibrio legallii]|uniref:ABC-type lipoprotein export system, ATPase component n=1 Tax=Desulfovibrio legallii TaxID=571438 RepID=A0A1G7R267_9BACT|nr:ABC transporter ATP-binding protein [Desulfovibrio legallii]SDG04891.1 ABC-type lipoprotein export system, ATPase component [Desulfovibrio legallii]
MALPLLEIHDLCKCHTARQPVFCVDITRLELAPGEAIGITGPSGCGKSTLLEMLALLTRPTTAARFLLRNGSRTCDLAAVWARAPQQLAAIRRRHLGFVHQAGGLYPFLTVRDNIALPLHLTGQENPAALTRRVDELLEFLGLQHVAQSLPEALSYGERQRTAVARALAHQPRLLLADEPTSALDPETALTTMTLLLQGARRSGAALLVVSHDHALLAATKIPALAVRALPDAAPAAIRYRLSLPPHMETAAAPQTAPAPRPATRQQTNAACPPPPKGKQFALLSRIAWQDFRHERALSLCAILAFAAALTPLLLLGGLRTGVITALAQRLLDNPAVLSVNPYSSQRYTEADIAALGTLPSVAFIVPLTRTLASSVLIARQGRPPVTADVLPTAQGDPLLARYASVPTGEDAVITRELARALPGVAPGSPLTLHVTRRLEGRPQSVALTTRVHAILPDAADWKKRVYLPLALLLAMEQYRDGLAVPERGWAGKPPTPAPRSFAGFRMYVDSLEAVIPIRDALKRRGIDAYTSAREVETLQNLRQALTLTALLVGGVTLAGMAFSLASLAVANVRRKALFFAQGALLGLTRRELLALPLLQMTFIALLAASCSLAFYFAAAALLNLAAAPWLEAGERACVLPGAHVCLLYGGALVLACLCGGAACRQLLSLQPAEVLRRDV